MFTHLCKYYYLRGSGERERVQKKESKDDDDDDEARKKIERSIGTRNRLKNV